MLVQVLLFPAMKPEENKPAGGAIKPQVRRLNFCASLVFLHSLSCLHHRTHTGLSC